MKDLYVLLDQEHGPYGVYETEGKAREAAINALRQEGIPEGDLEDYAEDWQVVLTPFYP